MNDLLSVNSIFFTVLSYPMSYLEFSGTIFNLWCVWLASRNKILNWAIGIVGSVLFAILFYQIQLYSDLVEQIYFIITGFWGWWIWTHPVNKEADKSNNELRVSLNSTRSNFIYLIIILIGTSALGYFMTKIHIILPVLFSQPASFAYLDAFTTVLTFAAQVLLIKRKVESWYLWILVDIIGIWLYFQKGVVFVSLLYFIFLILATKGLFSWRKIFLSYK